MKHKNIHFMAVIWITVMLFWIWTSIVLLTTIRQNPGPGAYEPKTSTSKDGKYFIASMKSSKAPTFSLPSLARFDRKEPHMIPGPGAYALKTGIADASASFISTVKGPKTRTFYHADRKTIDIPNDVKSIIIIITIM